MGEPFMNWLKEEAVRRIALTSDFDLLSEHEIEIDKTKVNCAMAILQLLDSIEYYEQGDTFVLCVNPNTTYGDTKIKLSRVVKTVEYGNSAIKGQGVISNIFNDISLNINYYYKKYRILRGSV